MSETESTTAAQPEAPKNQFFKTLREKSALVSRLLIGNHWYDVSHDDESYLFSVEGNDASWLSRETNEIIHCPLSSIKAAALEE